MTPPVVPRPNKTEEGPLSTSTSFYEERIADILSVIFHPVEIEIRIGSKPANVDRVTSATTFSGGNRQSTHILQGITQIEGILRLDQRFCHHTHRLRNIAERRVGLRSSGSGFGLIVVFFLPETVVSGTANVPGFACPSGGGEAAEVSALFFGGRPGVFRSCACFSFSGGVSSADTRGGVQRSTNENT